MAHPRMYDDGDPVLGRLRALAATLPGSVEKESWGRPTFRAPSKIYAVFGSADPHESALLIKPEEDERPALLTDPRFFRPPYYGPAGWLGLDLLPDADWLEIGELLASSYRQVATTTLLRELDAKGVELLRQVALDPAPGTRP